MSENLTMVNLEKLKEAANKIDNENEKIIKEYEKKIFRITNQYSKVILQNKSLQNESSKYYAIIELISNSLRVVDTTIITAQELAEHIESLITGILPEKNCFDEE